MTGLKEHFDTIGAEDDFDDEEERIICWSYYSQGASTVLEELGDILKTLAPSDQGIRLRAKFNDLLAELVSPNLPGMTNDQSN